MPKNWQKLLGLLSCIIICALSCAAQSSQGEIRGRIIDSNGAGIAGAQVEITNVATGESRTATTNDQGEYLIPKLNTGIYNVSADAAGFSKATTENVKVSVAFTTQTNLTLNPAGANATVNIATSDAATQINTTDQQLSTIIENKKILDLPLLSRNPSNLILLAPGTSQTTTALGGFSVNGQRERNNNFLVDGIDDNDADVPGIPGGIATPNIDATQEFRVITSNFNAEFGRNTGGVVNVATKNGTNEFHGNGYIYYRSDKFDARDFFDVSGQADPLQRRQYGGSIGGPIIKDRTFFFFNIERDVFDIGQQQTRIVPSALARQGIFKGTPFGNLDVRQNGANNVTGEVLGDPSIGLLPPGSPNLGLNPAVQQILKLYPLGNVSGQGPLPGVFDEFRFATVLHNPNYQFSTRIDHKISDKHNLSGSFTYSNGTFDLQAETFPGFGDVIRTPQKNSLLSLNLTSTLTPNLVNELRFGGNRVVDFFNGPGSGDVPTGPYDAIRSAFAANGVDNNIANFGGKNGQMVGLSFVATGTNNISDLLPFDDQFRAAGTTQIGDSVTYVKGSHTFKGGFDFRWVYSNGFSNFGRNEVLSFNTSQFGVPILADNSGNFVSTTGIGAALQNFSSFLYGFFGVQQQNQFYDKNKNRADSDYRGFRTREMGGFFEDTWKVRPNFTLNLGLRYEVNFVPYEVNGALSTLVDQNPNSATPAGGFQFVTVGKNSEHPKLKLWDNDFNNFAPRFGFNYSPSFKDGWLGKLTGGPGTMSIRGGFGVFYDRVFTNLFSNATSNPPFQSTYLFLFDLLNNQPRASTTGTSDRVVDGEELSPVLFPLPGNNIVQSKFATPYSETWNFGFQRQFQSSWLLEADYVGSKGVNQLRDMDGQMPSVQRINAILGTHAHISATSTRSNYLNGVLNTAFNQAFLNIALGQSSFNSFQTRVTKTFTNKTYGLGQFQVAYTWSHSIDDSADSLVTSAGERNLPRDSSGFVGGFAAEKGNSSFDVRQRLVVNFVHDIPVRFDNKALNAVFANWSASGIFQAQSGSPFSVFGGTDSAGVGLGQRADFATPGAALAPGNSNPRVQTGPDRTMFKNPCPADSHNITATTCSTGALIGRQGNVGRNAFVGPGYNNFDFSMIKRFHLTESSRVTLRADFFNLFNRVNLALPDNLISDLNFGLSTQTRPGSTPRVMQFAARIDF